LKLLFLVITCADEAHVKTTEKQIQEIISGYKSGKSCRKLAEHHGLSHVHVWRLLRNAGVLTPRAQRRAADPKEVAALGQKHATILHKSGIPAEEIALGLRRSKIWVQKALRSAGRAV
jgi:hypothetical protein